MLRSPILAFVLLALGAVCASGSAYAQANGQAQFDALIADAKKAMMSDPRAALKKAHAAETAAAKLTTTRDNALATSWWLEAESLTRLNKVKQGHAVLDKAIALASKDSKITKLDGDLALSLARVADNEANVQLALKSFQRAYDIFVKLDERRSQSIALQGLGGIYDEAHDFGREISYYRKASQVYSQDSALTLSAANNIGFALLQLGRYDEAAKNLQEALALAKKDNSAFLQSYVLTTLAAVYAKQHKFADADKAANRALKLLGKDDENGWLPFVWGVKGQIEHERGDSDKAAADFDRAFNGIDLKTTISPFRDLHQIAYKVYRDVGNWPLAMAHLEAFKRLDDEGRSLASSVNLALVGAQFDFANQKFEIAQLKAVQLQRDISLRESRAATQRVLFGAGLLAAMMLLGWIGWGYITMRRHRDTMRVKNIELTKTLRERDSEIIRRTEVEGELRQAKRTAEQANVAKSHFLANMSHELRTPLNAIIGFSEIIEGQVFGPVGNERYKSYATDINTGGRNLLAILNDILDMAKIDAGNEQLTEQELSLREVVEAALYEFDGPKSQGKRIRLEDGADAWVRCDSKRLQQIVVNLVSNAVKFTGADGSISVRIARDANGADIFVSDNGAGIPQDKLSMVLEPFGQAESAYARSHGGVGLGLPIVRSLVEMHGGSFSLESELDHGTVARVHLPAERLLLQAGAGVAS